MSRASHDTRETLINPKNTYCNIRVDRRKRFKCATCGRKSSETPEKSHFYKSVYVWTWPQYQLPQVQSFRSNTCVQFLSNLPLRRKYLLLLSNTLQAHKTITNKIKIVYIHHQFVFLDMCFVIICKGNSGAIKVIFFGGATPNKSLQILHLIAFFVLQSEDYCL